MFTTPDVVAGRPGGGSLGAVARLGAAAAAAGVGAFVFHTWAAGALGADRFARFGVTWTCVMLASQIVGASLEQWTSREATVGHRTCWSVNAGAVGFMGTATTVAAWVLIGEPAWAAVAAAGSVTLGLLHWRKGTLLGSGGQRRASTMLLVESAVRLAAVPLLGFAWAIPAGSAAGVMLGRPPGGLRPARRRCGAGAFVIGASTAAGAFQLLLGAAPLVVWAAGGTAEEVTGVFLVFLFSKAPLTLLFAVQSLIVSALTRNDDRTRMAMRMVTGRRLLGGMAAAAGVAGGLVLPAVVRMVAGVTFPPAAAGLVTAGVTSCAVIQLLGQDPTADGTPLVVARSWMWALGAGAAAGAVFVPVGLVWAVTVGFAAGSATAAGRTLVTWGRRVSRVSHATGPAPSGGPSVT